MNRKSKLLHWFVDHASWEGALALAKTYIWPIVQAGCIATTGVVISYLARLPIWIRWVCICVAVLCAALILWTVVIKLTRGKSQRLKINDIRFDYLPRSPLEHGWKLAYEDPGPPPIFGSAMDAPNRDGLAITVTRKYAIDYDVPPNAGICDRIRFAARFTDSTMFFTRIYVTSRDKSHSELVDLKFYVGNRKPTQTPGYPKEWTLWITGEMLDHGWMSFEIFASRCGSADFWNAGIHIRPIKRYSAAWVTFYFSIRTCPRNWADDGVSAAFSHRLKSAIPLLVVLALCLILGIRKVDDWAKSKKQEQKTSEDWSRDADH